MIRPVSLQDSLPFKRSLQARTVVNMAEFVRMIFLLYNEIVQTPFLKASNCIDRCLTRIT